LRYDVLQATLAQLSAPIPRPSPVHSPLPLPSIHPSLSRPFTPPSVHLGQLLCYTCAGQSPRKLGEAADARIGGQQQHWQLR
jgi:hypothetical protein